MDDKNTELTKRNQKLFRSDVDWWYNACINNYKDNWDLYAMGYKHAADIIVTHVNEYDCDLVVYPVVFLYRQYLELRLKEILKNGISLIDHDRDVCDDKPNHKIKDLWGRVHEILKMIWRDHIDKELISIDTLIAEFDKVDPFSTAFRYPTDKKGNKSLQGIDHINLRNISEVIEGIANLLDGASLGISEYLEFKAEMKMNHEG